MLFQRSAFASIPEVASILPDVAFEVDDLVSDEEMGDQRLEAAFDAMASLQPVLADFLAEEAKAFENTPTLDLADFLVLGIYMMFRNQFGNRMQQATEAVVDQVIREQKLDQEIRQLATLPMQDVDDWLAEYQPIVVHWIKEKTADFVEQTEGVDITLLNKSYFLALSFVIICSRLVSVLETISDIPGGIWI